MQRSLEKEIIKTDSNRTRTRNVGDLENLGLS
jgi:hypothetical protein